MRFLLIATLLVISLSAVRNAAVAQKAAAPNATAEGELANLAGEWLRAEGDDDRATLARLIAEDFIGNAFGGRVVTRDDILPPEGAGARHFPKTSLKETATRAFENAGVVMGSAVVEDPNQPGEIRFTLFFLKRKAGWQMVAAHLARVSPRP